MKQKLFGNRWESIVYGKSEFAQIKYYSHKYVADHDRRLKDKNADYSHKGLISWLNKINNWKKCAVFTVNAPPGTKYRVGFMDGKTCKLCKIVLSVNQHVRFAVRVGPRSVNFFIVADSPGTELTEAAYVDYGSEADARRYAKDILL